MPLKRDYSDYNKEMLIEVIRAEVRNNMTLNKALEESDALRREAIEQMVHQKKLAAAAEQRSHIAVQNLHAVTADFNRRQQEYAAEIKILKEKLRNGDNNRLSK